MKIREFLFNWRSLCFAVTLGMLMPASNVHAELYGHWPLDDGEGGEARNLAAPDLPGFIFDWDSLDSLGGTFEDPTVWVDDAERGTVVGLNGQSQCCLLYTSPSPRDS